MVEAVGPGGVVVGVDVEPIEPLDGVSFLTLDVTGAESVARIVTALGGPAALVVSDAAPKLTGIRDVDRAALEELWQAALCVAARVLEPGGTLVVKGFPGPEADAFRRELRGCFKKVGEVRPEGKRARSKEFYWLATGYAP